MRAVFIEPLRMPIIWVSIFIGKERRGKEKEKAPPFERQGLGLVLLSCERCILLRFNLCHYLFRPFQTIGFRFQVLT